MTPEGEKKIIDLLERLSEQMTTLQLVTQAEGWRASGIAPAQFGQGIQIFSTPAVNKTK